MSEKIFYILWMDGIFSRCVGMLVGIYFDLIAGHVIQQICVTCDCFLWCCECKFIITLSSFNISPTRKPV